jgi:hypothetical protein
MGGACALIFVPIWAMISLMDIGTRIESEKEQEEKEGENGREMKENENKELIGRMLEFT